MIALQLYVLEGGCECWGLASRQGPEIPKPNTPKIVHMQFPNLGVPYWVFLFKGMLRCGGP